MPFLPDGTYQRIHNWQNDAAADISILADRHDQEDDGFAAGLSETLTKSGKSQPTADIPMNGKRLTNLGEPAVNTDAATKAYADSIRTFTTALTVSGAAANARIKFTGTTGPWGFEFPTADLSSGVRDAVSGGAPARFVWNEKPDLSGQDIMTLMAGLTAQLGVGLAPPLTGHSGVYAGILSTNENVTFNAYYNAADSKWHYQGAGWAMLITAPTATGLPNIYKSKISGAADAVIEWGSLQYWDVANNVRFPSAVFAAGAYLNVDANISGQNPGSIWLNYGTGHADAYSAIDRRIENRAEAWAKTKLAYIRLTSETYVDANGGSGGPKQDPGAPWVATAIQKIGSDNMRLFFRALQYVDGNGNVTNIATV